MSSVPEITISCETPVESSESEARPSGSPAIATGPLSDSSRWLNVSRRPGRCCDRAVAVVEADALAGWLEPGCAAGAPPSAGAGRRWRRSAQCLLDLLLRGRSGLRPACARGATERQRAGQDPEHQPGDAERGEAHGQRPAEAVAGRTERSEQATEPVRAQPLGVLRPELEVPRSLDRRELACRGREADELGVERRAFGAGVDLGLGAHGLLAGRIAIGQGGDGQQVMPGVIGGIGLFVHLGF